eukprot:6282721-Alexandrium_andersonii.AAC.1
MATRPSPRRPGGERKQAKDRVLTQRPQANANGVPPPRPVATEGTRPMRTPEPRPRPTECSEKW